MPRLHLPFCSWLSEHSDGFLLSDADVGTPVQPASVERAVSVED